MSADMVIAALATVYTLFLIYAAGRRQASAVVHLVRARLPSSTSRRAANEVCACSRPAEAVLFGVIVLGAVAGVVSLATGAIEI